MNPDHWRKANVAIYTSVNNIYKFGIHMGMGMGMDIAKKKTVLCDNRESMLVVLLSQHFKMILGHS